MTGWSTSLDGWKVVRLGEVVRCINRTTRVPATNGLRRVVGLDHMDPESLPLRRWDELDELSDGTSFTRTFEAGQVLFGKRRAYQRKVSVPDFEGICSSDILVFEVSSGEMLQAFLPYVIQSDDFFEHALGTSAGSLSPRTKWQELAKYEFSLPPVDEQRQAIRLLAAAEAVTDGYRHALETARAFERSHFKEAVKAWGVRRLGDFADVSLGRQRAPKYDRAPGQTRYLRAANVKDGRLLLEDVLAMAFSPDEVRRFGLRAGDVVVTEGCGSLSAIGANVAWNDELPGPICFQNTLIRLRSTSGALDQRYLAHWASNAYTSGLFASIATGTSILHLGGRRTADLELPLPPIDAQARLVEQFEAVSALKSALASAADAARALRKALLGSLLEGRV